MAPIPGDHNAVVKDYIQQNAVMLFSKTTCSYCNKLKDLFKSLGVNPKVLELNKIDNGPALQSALAELSGQRTVPNVFVGGVHVGGCDATLAAHREDRLMPMVQAALAAANSQSPSSSSSSQRGHEDLDSYDYDLIVIGGGSGGLAAAKEAANLGKKVACLDFVKPSPQGTSWGLGGTCVNVGCIPKKLMHQAAILGHSLEDARKYGWEFPTNVQHNWETMKNAIQDHIGSLNWNYRVQLRNKKVDYHNAYGEFIGPHRIKCTNKRGKVQEFTSRYFILATGGRPRYPNIPGLVENCISSDDLFSLPHCPGKTLCIGASYVSLECAGFLQALGLDVSVMVRSIFLRGFDQQMADKVGDYMGKHGVKVVRPCVPTKFEKLEDGSPGKIRVTATRQDTGEVVVEEYNTVMVAVGRDPCTKGIGLETLGIELDKAGFVRVADDEQTSCPYVYAVGDVLEGKPELTPVAIQAGQLLSKRLFGGQTAKCDYINVPTTVFTPLEYGAIGYSEEDAVQKFGQEDLEIYHTNFWPLEWTVPHREDDACYAKLICLKSQNERVIGFHVAGPNAGEITQGFTVGMKLGATKADFDSAIGIHPTCAEIFTTLSVTKSSGQSVAAEGC